MGVAVFLAAAVAGGIIAVIERGEARDAARFQLVQRLGAQALVEEELALSLLLASQTVAIDNYAPDPRLPARRAPAQSRCDRDPARSRRRCSGQSPSAPTGRRSR